MGIAAEYEKYEQEEADTETSPTLGLRAKILAQVMKGEGTDHDSARRTGYESGYHVPFGYEKYTTPSTFLSDMKVGDVKDYQIKQIHATKGKVYKDKPNIGTSAVGAFQVIRNTLAEAQADMGFSDDDVFSPVLQAQIGEWLLEKRGITKFEEAVASGDQELIKKERYNLQKGLANEWASVADPDTGESAHDQATGTSQADMDKILGKWN